MTVLVHLRKTQIFMTRFVALLFPVLFLFGTLSAQDGPCLKIIQNGETNTVDCPPTGKHADALSPQLKVEFRHPDKKASVSGNGWLKTFWIFGDGNFAAFPDTDQAREEATLDMDYTYSKGGEYVVTPVMIEKKTNKTPPREDYRKINVKGDPPSNVEKGEAQKQTASGTAFRKELVAPNKSAMLLSSQVRLGGYETALAVSSPMPSSGTQSVVLFFYNSVKTKDIDPQYRAGDLFKTGSVSVTKSNYQTRNASSIACSTLPLFLDPGRTASVFQSVLVQPVLVDPNLVPVNFTEFRFFPMLTTPAASNNQFNTGIADIDRTGMGRVQFVSLLLQNVVAEQGTSTQLFPGQSTVDSLTPAERDRILTLMNQHLPWLLSRVNNVTLELRDTTGAGSGIYVRGISQTSTEIVSVIDPTQLVVNKICPDANTPGTFVADLTMTVCNEGNTTESKVEVDLIKSPGLQFTDLSYSPDQISNILTSTEANSIWHFDYGLNGGLKGAYETGQYVSSCFDVHFTLKTDWNGVMALQKGKGLTAKVHFTTAIVNAEQEFPNIPFEEAVVTPETGYRCLEPTENGDCWWWIVILFALALTAWWWWNTNRNEPS